MKTKKVLALVVLAAFLISIVPFAAFALPTGTATNPINTYNTRVLAPEGSAETTIYFANDNANRPAGAPADWKNSEDANTFELSIVGNNAGVASDADLYIASNRLANDRFFWSLTKDGTRTLIPAQNPANDTGIYKLDLDSITGLANTLFIHVESNTPGKANIVFGTHQASVIAYNAGASFDLSAGESLNNIIGQQKYAIEFEAANPNNVVLTSDAYSGKRANNVDTYTLTAYVTTNNIPASGRDVTFSILSGSGATLTQTRVTTNIAGRAETKIYSSRPGNFEIEAKVSGNVYARLTDKSITDEPKKTGNAVVFGSTGIISIKAESADNQKVARNSTSTNKSFNFSAYDAAGNRIDFSKTGYAMDVYMGSAHVDMKADIVSKPSGAALRDTDIKYGIHSSGNGQILVPINKLTKDGDYEVKIYLPNGVSVSYKFSAKDQGEVTKMILSYGSASYSGGTVLPQPEIKYQDAEGYETSQDFVSSGSLKLSISDASFMDGAMDTNGRFKLKDDKSGVITMTAVDTNKNLVATQVLNIEKPASYLKLTPQSVGAVGGEVTVNIEPVDIDGKLAASGIGIGAAGAAPAGQASASIIAKPEGAVTSASTVDTSDLSDGKANVKVSSNMEGDVTLQVIITEDSFVQAGTLPAYGGRTYTGACTVSFGKASTGAGQVIFIVGAPSYVTGNKVVSAESPSFIENGRTFLGVRDMGTSIGATIEWDQASQTATLSKDGITIKVTVGASKIAVTKNGVTSEIEIDAPAQNKNGRVYLPFRAVMEAFNYTVTFDQATNSIVCTL